MSVLKQVIEILSARNLDTFSKISQIPHFDTLLGVSKASKLIKDAILGEKKIAVVGDYDVDGISCICIMQHFFEDLGYQNITFKIPNRFSDGYGINVDIVKELDADVYITVDNGISAFEVAEFCRALGKILIITDHHKPLLADGIELLPNADAIINPNQQACNFIQKDICGAVVAFYLCGGIKNALGASISLDKYTPFLALAIIADMMPLISLNRALFKYGVAKMMDSNITAFKILKNTYTINAHNIGFHIAPMINSAGRLQDAKIALDFLRERNLARANMLLEKLVAINNERKIMQSEITQMAIVNALESENFVISYGKGWHQGVLGIVAARLAEKFNKSAFCLSHLNIYDEGKKDSSGVDCETSDNKSEDRILKGSGRARGGINLIHSIQQCKDLLLGFGGHSGAVGLSLKIENLGKFIEELNKKYVLDSTKKSAEVVCARLCDIDKELLEVLESYEPYGVGNEQILFYASDVFVENATLIGKDKNHQRLQLSQDGHLKNAIIFNNNEDLSHKNINITFGIQKDLKNGRDGEVQIVIGEVKS